MGQEKTTFNRCTGELWPIGQQKTSFNRWIDDGPQGVNVWNYFGLGDPLSRTGQKWVNKICS